jgi:hypothetical protein
VDVLFKRTPEGWTFNSSYPRIFFGPWSTYLLTDAQKAALEQRLNRYVLMSIVLAFMLVGLGDFTLIIMVPDLDASSPKAWLLVCVVGIVVAIPLIPVLFFFRHRVIEPVLSTARHVGPAQPDRLGFIVLKDMIKRYTERKSANFLIIWIALLLLLSADNTIRYALVIPARGFSLLFLVVALWLVTLWYAALLVFKLRAQRSGRMRTDAH